MRRAIAMGVVVTLLGIPGGAWAAGNGNGRGKPEPIPCPEDVDAAVAAACPCEGTVAPDESVTPWRNHGQYVRCVVKYRNQLKKSGCVTPDERPSDEPRRTGDGDRAARHPPILAAILRGPPPPRRRAAGRRFVGQSEGEPCVLKT